MSEDLSLNAVELATELTVAWLGNPNNRVAADDVPAFLEKMHVTVTELAASSARTETPDEGDSTPEYAPAVTVRKSLASKDHIVSMIDGKPYRMLKKHLSRNGLTPAQYRERYNLRSDYPMVAETYSEARRAMALRIGLGQQVRQAKAAAGADPAAKPKRAPLRPKFS